MGRTQTVALIDGRLYLNALPLIPQSETIFDSTGAPAEFVVDRNGAVTHLILSQTEGDAEIRSQALRPDQDAAFLCTSISHEAAWPLL